jgi:capsular exopolysaccharide synthesis family protein
VENDPRVILVTSAEPSEGKTLCAANLGVTMAQSGSRVAIIDCDMRRPKMHTVFQIDRNAGVSNIMTGARDLSEVVYNNGIPNLSVIPCGPIPPNPSELLGSKRMADFIEELKGSYERVIIDSPPLTAVTDSAVLAQVCDGVVVVVRAGVTTRHAVQNAVSQLKSLNVRILGALLNGVSTRRDSYYYQYYYYYYYGGDREHGKKKRRRGHSRTHAAA